MYLSITWYPPRTRYFTYRTSFNLQSNHTRLIAFPLLQTERTQDSKKGGISSRSHSPKAAKPWWEPRSASLQSLNSFYKSCQLPGHLGVGLLVFGMDGGFNKLLEACSDWRMVLLAQGASALGEPRGRPGLRRTMKRSWHSTRSSTAAVAAAKVTGSRRRFPNQGLQEEGLGSSFCASWQILNLQPGPDPVNAEPGVRYPVYPFSISLCLAPFLRGFGDGFVSLCAFFFF